MHTSPAVIADSNVNVSNNKSTLLDKGLTENNIASDDEEFIPEINVSFTAYDIV